MAERGGYNSPSHPPKSATVPQSCETVQCGERVAIVLDPIRATLWRDSGASWSAINSRIVSAQPQLYLSASSKFIVTIVSTSVNAPTHWVPVEVKEEFFDDLQVSYDLFYTSR